MDFLLFLIGTDEPLEGDWERLDDAFAGCVIHIEKTGADFTGRIVSLPQAMTDAGWRIGEPKWQDIRPDGTSRWLIRDLRKHFDTRSGRVVGIDLQEYNLSLAAGGRLRLHTGSLPLFPIQSWKRISLPPQK
jgi:hypothetical protein